METYYSRNAESTGRGPKKNCHAGRKVDRLSGKHKSNEKTKLAVCSSGYFISSTFPAV